ncbi:hypothetical protein HHI36_023372 [Cryptolaemus montrouzieri]|uniref:Reverse transcriptase domain-containing protein n=1 Tax=Cryptolaemus montrouzieri TaxID=559131 RepID=A0ABD2PGX2_9CUCU
MESIIEKRLTKELEEKADLHPIQFGFRKNRSTTDAIMEDQRVGTYADDLASVIIERGTVELKEKAEIVSANIIRELKKKRLELASEKTEAVLLIKRRKAKRMNYKVNGHTIHIQKSTEYLGVMLDEDLRM